MFTIRLYNFNKKPNSTAVPVIAGTQYQCTMKTVSSLLSPVIDIADTKGTGAIPLFNYAYIADFGRYYFIDDVSWSQGIWSLSMHVDVLGSFKEDIENSRQYVIRSASSSNGYIPDTVYNTYVDGAHYIESAEVTVVQRQSLVDGSWSNVSYFDRTLAQGTVAVGVVTGTLTGITYYTMSTACFQRFLNKVFTLTPSNMTDLQTGTANAVFDPIQYITYVKWFPVSPLPTLKDPSVTTIAVGGQTVSVSDDMTDLPRQWSGTSTQTFRFTVTLPVHPNAAAYPYLKMSPFSEYALNFQPFGNIPLDSTKLMGYTYITVKWKVDYCTGTVILYIYAGADDLIYTETSDYGVTLPISTLKMDWKAGLAMSAMTWLKNNTLMGSTDEPVLRQLIAEGSVTQADLDAAGVTIGNTSLLDKIMDATGAALGTVATKGSAGSFLSYNSGGPFVTLWYLKQTPHDVDRYGEPLCANVRLDSLSGFCLCSNAAVNYAVKYPMNAEQLSILRYLNTGVFLE